MTLADVEELLKRTMGLDAVSIGTAAIERAVQQRMEACGLKDTTVYGERLNGSVDELQELIESVIVPETWFFRDREAFATLAQVAAEEWRRENSTGVLRVLSLPCSTGEEPYSAAMALLDAGLPAGRFRIDALDISRRALAFARRGVFGRNSFRGGDFAFRDRHFTAAGTGWQLGEPARQAVEFRPGNVLEAGQDPGAATYDVIFCRNLLIYFDRPTQDRAIASLTRLLSPQGWLFVGPSETGLLLSHAFVSAKVPLAFAFRRRSSENAVPAPPAGLPPATRRSPVVSRDRAPVRAMPFSSVTLRPVVSGAKSVATNAPGLEPALRLADQGRLVEAGQACAAHLAAHGPSAQLYYVIGLVSDAGGEPAAAAESYRKCLYLDPQHEEALVHLASLLEMQGDRAGARILNDRARRVQIKART